ncbi:Hypothetical predicted protein [Cloeon dipterum]|uniref:Secreted protein n=1 Tax=Cloeon dipterum TaxID=197152 RepID=A0A8S1CRV8_9INSE|nr:Hypothetical predicted protein [Cloeon dipterum]
MFLWILVAATSATLQAEFSPSKFPFATAPFNLEDASKMDVSKNFVNLPVTWNANEANHRRCTITMQTVHRIDGTCIDPGKTDACSAGAFVYPFHQDCIAHSRVTTGE